MHTDIFFDRHLGAKKTILVGLSAQLVELVWYGVSTAEWGVWAAGMMIMIMKIMKMIMMTMTMVWYGVSTVQLVFWVFFASLALIQQFLHPFYLYWQASSLPSRRSPMPPSRPTSAWTPLRTSRVQSRGRSWAQGQCLHHSTWNVITSFDKL